ncbi:MAG: ABC transporter substrate-binding protein [Bdellovibrionales bacterium]|nr:ABC transporter substrate-binding protein [Bdellovibrionales bacterium]
MTKTASRLLCAMSVLSVGACTRFSFVQSTATLRIAYVDTPSAYLLFAAADSDCPRQEGLNLQLNRRSVVNRDTLSEMAADRADLAVTFVTPLVLATSGANENGDTADIGVLAEIYNSSRNMAIIAPRSLGIRKMADLNGRSVGFTQSSAGEWYLDLVGITEGIAKIHRMPVTDGAINLQRFKAHKLDALVIGQPIMDELFDEFDERKFSVLTTPVYAETGMLAVKKSRLKKLQPAIEKLLKCLVKAEKKFPPSNPQAVELLKRYVSPHSDRNLVKFLARSSMSVRLSNTLAALYDEQTRWVHSRPKLRNTPFKLFNHFVLREPLEHVSPLAVTLDTSVKEP